MKTFKRKCPNCKISIIYITKNTCEYANKHKIWCVDCKEKRRIKNKKKPRILKRNHITNKWKKNISSNGKSNGMYGKTVYEVWEAKYGKEEADKKLSELKKKLSISSSGKNNGMYGKPSPMKSGNGWKGWLDDVYFRSLLELSFLHNLIENKISYINGEKSEYCIDYLINKEKRTYYPDYIVGNKMYEIKPEKLWNNKFIILKRKAAEKWCLKNNMLYILFEPVRLDNKIVMQLMKNNRLKFLRMYKKKVLNYLRKNK